MNSWFIVFISSLVLLVIVLFKYQHARQWLSYLGIHIVVASFLIYFINLISAYTHVTLPINAATVGTVSLLGVPGLMLLIALKLFVV